MRQQASDGYGIGSATNYVEFQTNDRFTAHGDVRTENHIRIGAGSWIPHGSYSPIGDFLGCFRTLAFDNSSDDWAFYTIEIPYFWDSTTAIHFVIDWYYASSGNPGTVEDAGTVRWNIEYKSIAPSERVDTAGTIISKTSAGNQNSDCMVRTIFTEELIAANLAVGDTCGIRLFRDVDDGGDTLAVDAIIINTHFHVIRNALGQSIT